MVYQMNVMTWFSFLVHLGAHPKILDHGSPTRKCDRKNSQLFNGSIFVAIKVVAMQTPPSSFVSCFFSFFRTKKIHHRLNTSVLANY